MAKKDSFFELGNITITRNAFALLVANKVRVDCLLQRHSRGDWGKVSDLAARRNYVCISNNNRATSIYPVGKRNVVWVITDPAAGMHAAQTYVIRPEEYAHVCTAG